MESKEILRKLGFPEYETNVLLLLSSEGKSIDAKQISSGSGVPITKLYSVLIALEKKGLIIRLPGAVNLYRMVEKGKFVKAIKDQKETQLAEEKEKMEKFTKLLESGLKGLPSKEVTVRYFTSDKEYWGVYNEEVNKLKKTDTYRLINNMRWAHSFLPEEVESKPDIKSMIINDFKKMKQGQFFLHHMVNVKALLQNTINDLRTKEKIKKSIAQLLYYYGRDDLKKNHYITLAPDMKNILIVILRDSTFFEFYSPDDHTRISSAIQIRSKDIARDFAKWFDAYSKEKHDSKKDYEKFKKEMLKQAKELAKINPSELEQAIKETKPIYG